MLDKTSKGVMVIPSNSSSDVAGLSLGRCSSDEPSEVLAELYHEPLVLLGGCSPGAPKLSAVVRLWTEEVEAVCMLLGRPRAIALRPPLPLLKGTGTATAPPTPPLVVADDDDDDEAAAAAKGENSSWSESSSDCAPAVEDERVPSVSAVTHGSCWADE